MLYMKCPNCLEWLVKCPCCDEEFCPTCQLTKSELEEEMEEEA
jgi:hypothetical protein